MKRSRRQSSKPTSTGSRPKPRRNVVVLTGLMGALVFTSVLLLALTPAPLVPDAGGLVATDRPDEFDIVFNTPPSIQAARWQYIYVHHSRSRRGNAFEAEATGDHFVIGNGDGYPNGAIQIGHRWARQESASVAGSVMNSDVICICLVGDFNVKAPTDAQMTSLNKLTDSLQRRLAVPGRNVVIERQQTDARGVGRLFPVEDFRSQIRP